MHPWDPYSIFTTGFNFDQATLDLYSLHYKENSVYRQYCDLIGRTPQQVKSVGDIPFLPIQFFKTKRIGLGDFEPQIRFSSSGTTGMVTAQHLVKDLGLYEQSFRKGFSHFYGPITDYCVLALLPAYLERQGSSLIYMAQDMITKSGHPHSGFYLNNLEKLTETLKLLEGQGQKTLLLGVSFALLDLAEQFPQKLAHTIVMETGGMKGRRKEMIREELHAVLKQGLGVDQIHSEYGMTELLSQAYSTGNSLFKTPPWMRVMARSTDDPLGQIAAGKSGGLNIIDLANSHSCPFIATQDLGKVYPDGSFEVLGRFDHADVRGCNLMVL
jgi:hypothetical protein